MPYKNYEDQKAQAYRWRAANRDKYLASIKKRNRKRSRETRRAWQLKERYNLTPEQYANIFASQGGRCAMNDCRTPDPGGRHNQWHVDHDHETGIVRGILCAACNIKLGTYEKLKLRAAAFEQYLTKGMLNA